MSRVDLREHVPSILVAGLSSAFGVSLLQISSALATMISADDVTGSSGTVALMLNLVAAIFIVISIYVGAVVIANTFSTIVAGRARTIALYRLVGSSAAAQRRTIAREGLVVGVVGAIAGALVGTGVAMVLVQIGIALGTLPALAYTWVSPQLAIPMVAVVAATLGASWIGSRRVLTVTPLQAIGGAEELSREDVVSRRGRNVAAIVLFVLGSAALALGVVVGLVTPAGVLIGLVGGILSFTGLIMGAHLIMPPALRVVGRIFGQAPPARLASENALRYPERSSRTTIGLVIGVTLITMFGVAIESYGNLIRAAQGADPEFYAGIDQVLVATQAVFSALVGFSALIAAVGLINNLSLSVLQRTRELGLLRALGFSVRQLRRMVLIESAQLTIAAVLVGLVLGAGYGWAGAQSLLGSINGSPGLIAPGIPWPVIGVVVLGAALLTVVASVTPSRRATRVSPVTALAVD